ncbi:fungal hydrophobin [Tylopilus felleus]
MFSRLATLLPLAAFVAVATAAPNARSTCSTGNTVCCNQAFSNPLTFLPVVGSLISAVVNLDAGITCTPISVLALSGTSCTSQVACCDNDNFNSLVGVSCSPINVNA